MLVDSPAFRSMAVGIMLSVIFVLAATLTLLPAVLGKLGGRVDKLTPLPVWNSVTTGYASAGSSLGLDLPDDAREPALIEPRP